MCTYLERWVQSEGICRIHHRVRFISICGPSQETWHSVVVHGNTWVFVVERIVTRQWLHKSTLFCPKELKLHKFSEKPCCHGNREGCKAFMSVVFDFLTFNWTQITVVVYFCMWHKWLKCLIKKKTGNGISESTMITLTGSRKKSKVFYATSSGLILQNQTQGWLTVIIIFHVFAWAVLMIATCCALQMVSPGKAAMRITIDTKCTY